MPAGYQELFLEQGAHYSTSITLDDSDGNAFDLTNFDAKSQIRKSYYSSNPTAEFTVNIPTPNNGTINLTMTSNITANVASGRYVYDVVVKNNSSNTVIRVLEGIVNVMPQVTKF
jgi:hypothetical protein